MRKLLICFICFIALLVGLFCIMPKEADPLMDCIEFGICKDGLSFYHNDKMVTMSKSYCVNNHYVWDEKYSSCNIRKTNK